MPQELGNSISADKTSGSGGCWEVGLLLPRRVTPFVVTARSNRGREVEGRIVTKPIIFTYLLLPASRHVILNGLSDPWAGFEPLENMVSQMKLSQETACVRQQAFQALLTCRLLERHDKNLQNPHFLKQKNQLVSILSKDVCVITNSLVLKLNSLLTQCLFYVNEGVCSGI